MLLDSINYSVLAVVKCSSEAPGFNRLTKQSQPPTVTLQYSKCKLLNTKYNRMAMLSGTWAVILK